MTKKIYFSLLISIVQYYFCVAQPPGDNNESKLEAIKMAYMTKELNLNPTEAQRFWPEYNSYMREVKQAGVKFQNDEPKRQEKVAEITKKYKDNFQRILGNDGRVNKTFTADRNYRDMLTRELQNRQRMRKPEVQKTPNKNNNRNYPENRKRPLPNN